MQPTHKVSITDQICTLDVTGKITPRQCEEHIREMVDCAQNEGNQRFLLDLQETVYVGSIVSQYEMAYRRADKLGWHRGWKVALLVSPSDHSHDFQTVTAQNAGYNLKQFDSKQTALKWLSQ